MTWGFIWSLTKSVHTIELVLVVIVILRPDVD